MEVKGMIYHVGLQGKWKGCLLAGVLLLCTVSILSAAPEDISVPKFETPILITTAGQSIDYEIPKVVCNRLKISNETNNLAKPEDLKGKKTLVIVPGHSNKGLGTAGINVEGETKRVKALLAEAGKNNISIVLMHLGGSVRRSGDSDPFIKQVLAYAKFAVVWGPGNSDQYFTKACAEMKIPLIIIDKVSDLTGILKSMFLTK
jgi:hypothetical protein